MLRLVLIVIFCPVLIFLLAFLVVQGLHSGTINFLYGPVSRQKRPTFFWLQVTGAIAFAGLVGLILYEELFRQ